MLNITRGVCHIMFGHDIGYGIDLDRAQVMLSSEGARRAVITHGPRSSASIQYEPPPVRFTRTHAPIAIAGRTTAAEVELVLYDFGAVCIAWRVAIDGPIEAIGPLAVKLYENVELIEASRALARDVLDRIVTAVSHPRLSPLVEDYVTYHVESWEGDADAGACVFAHRADVARLLRAEAAALSPEEVAEAVSVKTSYTSRDVAVIDWNAALLLGPDQGDVLSILEFANVELLELRYLDARLDAALEDAHEAVQAGTGLLGRASAANLRRIAGMQVDAAMLFEGVNNALKLVGDQYLARVYRLAGQRLHLPQWDASILRKLGTLETIYDKINDRQATRRMEILEWIIIILIAVSMVMPFMKL